MDLECFFLYRVLGVSTTLVRVVWDPPEKTNGTLKNYFIYNGDTFVEQTNDLTCTINGLQSATGYDLYVCASNNAGKSDKASLRAVTCDIGDTLPEKPWFAMVGRREVQTILLKRNLSLLFYYNNLYDQRYVSIGLHPK